MQNPVRNTSESWLLSIWLTCISSYCSLQWCDRTTTRWAFPLAYHVIFKCPVTRIARKSSSCFIYGIAVTNWKIMDSITCTTVPCDIHQWCNDILSSVEHGSKRPWGANIKVPNASSNFEDFISIGMKNPYYLVCMVMDSAARMGKGENTWVA